MTASSSAHRPRRTRSSGRMTDPARSPSRSGRFDAGYRACRRSWLRAAGSTVSRQVCGHCAGWPTCRPEPGDLVSWDPGKEDDMPTSPLSTGPVGEAARRKRYQRVGGARRLAGWVGSWRGAAYPGGPQGEIALFGEARGQGRRPEVGLAGGRGVAGTFEQVCPYRFEAVGVCHPVVGVEGAEQGEPGSGAVDHGEGYGAAERDHGSGRYLGKDVVQREDLRPVGLLRRGGLVVQRGDRSL